MPQAEDISVVVYGAEPVQTPAGLFIAWRVDLTDDISVWYHVDSPHTLLQYHDGFLTYVLAE